MGGACGSAAKAPEATQPKPEAKTKAKAVDKAVDEQVANKSGTGEAELASDGLLPNSEAFDEVVDMDAPKPGHERRTEASVNPVPPGAQGQKRFRKRSVNITTLPDDQLKAVCETFRQCDKENTGSISRADVAQILKENYTPTAAEVDEVMQWMDSAGNGNVSFDEYTVAMASVLTKSGLGEEDSIETARAALSNEMQARAKEKEKAGVESPGSQLKRVGSLTSSEENVKNAVILIGEEKLGHMRTRFDTLDSESKGFLEQEQVQQLVKLTYVAPEHSIESFMRFFTVSTDGADSITLDSFTHGLTLLYGDFTFVLGGANTVMSPTSPLSPAPGSPIPAEPISPVNLEADQELIEAIA